ncbi:zinc finger protein ZAT7-like [Oryza glaberrima]|uniref:C2H2-type domain-containing protein n=3 Tax=Oryza TaxID=4527 RepID=A0A0D3G8M3_9ORYZ|nr:zinc finger protein ZAT7-like [Oryza glaberrima]
MASGQRAVGEGSGGLRPTTHVAGGGGSARGEYFRCKTCSKTFTSFQALGGHRTGHTRMAARQRQEHGAAGAAVVGATNNQRRVVSAHQWHLCAVCGVEFRMGQALGGHMRRHRGEAAAATPPAAAAAASAGAVSSVEPPEMLDLNSPPAVEEAGEGDQEVERAEQEPRLLNLLV